MTDFPSVSAGKKSRPSAFSCAPCVKWRVPASRRSSLRAPAVLDRGRRRGFFAAGGESFFGPPGSTGRRKMRDGLKKRTSCGIICASAALSFRHKNRGAYDGRRRERLFPAKPLYSALTTTCCFFCLPVVFAAALAADFLFGDGYGAAMHPCREKRTFCGSSRGRKRALPLGRHA